MAYNTTTRGTLLARIQDRLISPFWIAAELDLYINEALRVWNALTSTSYSGSDYAVSTTITSSFNDLSTTYTDLVYVQRINTSTASIGSVSLDEIDNTNPTWQSDTGGTSSNFAAEGLNYIIFYPTPSSSFTAYFTTVRTAIVPASDSDFIQIAEEDIEAIIDYVIFVARLKEGGAELQGAIPLLQNFLKQAAQKNASLNNSAVFRRLLGVGEGGQAPPRPSTQATPTTR